MQARTHLEDVLEDVLLHRRVVHAHRAAADLDAVEHQVVVLPADLTTSRLSTSINRPRIPKKDSGREGEGEGGRRTSSTRPSYSARTSSHIGAVNG